MMVIAMCSAVGRGVTELYLLASYCDISLQDIIDYFCYGTLPSFSLVEYQWNIVTKIMDLLCL